MQKLPAAIAAAAALMCGCGYVSGPIAPLANIPMRVADVAALQRGGTIFVHFTVPARTTENNPIREPLRVELKAGATQQPARELKPGTLASYEIPSAPFTGEEAAISARALGANGKAGDWSPAVTLPVVPPLPAPTGLVAVPANGGVRLTWRAAGPHFRLLRRANDDPYAVVAPDLTTPEYLDTGTVLGTPYSYVVQSLQPISEGRFAESDLSGAAHITPEPPPPPAVTGLHVVNAANSVELTWDTAGPDITAYRIYRNEANSEFTRIGETGGIPTYSDRTAQPGKTFHYAVSAVDASGREGPRSTPIEVTH
ncbi:MAG TPA: hypothetical protein VN736_21825 [Candidatus Limnocylindrales bacterium]|nr:hypothetical protein [Candidatus Limnocylindrales bacterium]